MSKSLSIAALESTGALVSETPVEKQIDWYEEVDGKLVPAKYTVHVLCLSFKRIEDITRASMATKESPGRSVTVALIAEGVLFDNGQTKLTHEQADRLAPELVTQLIKAFNEVNGKGDAGGKSS